MRRELPLASEFSPFFPGRPDDAKNTVQTDAAASSPWSLTTLVRVSCTRSIPCRVGTIGDRDRAVGAGRGWHRGWRDAIVGAVARMVAAAVAGRRASSSPPRRPAGFGDSAPRCAPCPAVDRPGTERRRMHVACQFPRRRHRRRRQRHRRGLDDDPIAVVILRTPATAAHAPGRCLHSARRRVGATVESASLRRSRRRRSGIVRRCGHRWSRGIRRPPSTRSGIVENLQGRAGPGLRRHPRRCRVAGAFRHPFADHFADSSPHDHRPGPYRRRFPRNHHTWG